MGEGNGLNLLLHGGPGSDSTLLAIKPTHNGLRMAFTAGKALTAESIAEVAETPLYKITCGNVSTMATDAEKCLESVLHPGKI